MKLLWRLAVILLILVAINAAIERERTCICEADCWCKRPGLRHFRWVLPVRHHLPQEGEGLGSS